MFPSISASTALPSFVFWLTRSYLLVFQSCPNWSSCSLQSLFVNWSMVITSLFHNIQVNYSILHALTRQHFASVVSVTTSVFCCHIYIHRYFCVLHPICLSIRPFFSFASPFISFASFLSFNSSCFLCLFCFFIWFFPCFLIGLS